MSIPEERSFADRRRALMERYPDGLILVHGHGAEGTNPSFFYLTGVDEPRGALLLAPRGVRVETGRMHPGPDYVRGRMARQILFLPTRDPLAARWGEDSAATQESLSAEQAQVDAVLATGELETVLTQALAESERFDIVRSAPPNLTGADDADSALVARVAHRFANVAVGDATPAVHAMRRLKDAGEVRAIERAIGVTAEAIEAVRRAVRPGMREHELEAEIARVYRSHGGTHAFDPIVGAGINSCALHYTRNEGPIEEGQVLLVDTGASIDGYKGDITRTFPVGDRFSERQREIYEVVLRAEEETIAACKPGALLGDLHALAYEVIDRAGYGEFFVHGTGHHLGLETHDVGDVHEPLAPGAVVTIEPGIYLQEEGIGVRIEDDVLITADGHRVLSQAIPKSLDDLER
jgi:Xaa-Pro aminopeptidase